ncbi:MAG TPA: 23S rRNA (uracil(1939)-C(5))-methyltransferase RlmD [Steroidobacteraceae bacterium]|nr:23S rRNA (uracil(1939)-C(5))-methyltransferase RlmD [Steroidobacteraceae bacterium]
MKVEGVTETELGTVDALTHEGEGVVHGGKTVFIAGALPGEVVRFRRARRRSRHDEAELIEVVRPAPERTEPRCAHFGVCGGCALQHFAVERQIEAKQLELAESLARIAHAEPRRWLEALRGPAWGYRRRARLGARYVAKKGRVLVGFRERLAPYVTATERCEVLAPPTGALIGPLSETLTQLDVRERIPQIEVAVGESATALVLRVLAEPTAADLATLERFERAHGVRLYLQRGGLETVTRLSAERGDPLDYRLAEFGVRIEFEPTDFVQVNAPMNGALVSRAVSLLELTPASRVLDLYCGLGNFTLPLARRAAEVLGVEGEPGLIERARHNAHLNGIGNATFITADLAQPLPPDLPWLTRGFSHVLLDPPRAGARDVMRTIARIAPERVLYISCHPGSLARDVGVLVHDHGFALEAAGVVDMFPHTTHVESIALLEPGG